MADKSNEGKDDDQLRRELGGKLCRCGCGGVASHIMWGTEFGKPYPPEACCYSALCYCAEAAAGFGDEHFSIQIAQRPTL